MDTPQTSLYNKGKTAALLELDDKNSIVHNKGDDAAEGLKEKKLVTISCAEIRKDACDGLDWLSWTSKDYYH